MKNGVIIDGRGSYSIDQQRYNGQFGGHIFWEIKNGKITRQVTDVTYNAITTDFWSNLDGITGKDEWVMHGTGGSARSMLNAGLAGELFVRQFGKCNPFTGLLVCRENRYGFVRFGAVDHEQDHRRFPMLHKNGAFWRDQFRIDRVTT